MRGASLNTACSNWPHVTNDDIVIPNDVLEDLRLTLYGKKTTYNMS